jgi:hypothetical protein
VKSSDTNFGRFATSLFAVRTKKYRAPKIHVNYLYSSVGYPPPPPPPPQSRFQSMPVRGLYITSEWHSMVALHNPRTGILWELDWLPHYPHYHRIKISNRRAAQRCNVSAFFYAEICSLLARRRSSQPVQRVYWPENVIDWLGRWRPTCVMRHWMNATCARPFYMDLYSLPLPPGN